jgi:hypothetical protein
MSVCTICLAQGIIQGTVHMPSDERLKLILEIEPLAGSELEGPRRAELEAEITEGSPDDGRLSASGVLFGSFVVEDKEAEAPASVEMFFREGEVAFVNVTVDRSDGGAVFAANLRLDTMADAVEGAAPIRGLAFIGHPEDAPAG